MTTPRSPLSPKSQLDIRSLFQTATGMTYKTHLSLFSPFLVAAEDTSTTTRSLFSGHHTDEYARVSDESSDVNTDIGVSDILGGLPPLLLPSTPLPPPVHHQHKHDTDMDSPLFSVVDNPSIRRERVFGVYHHDRNHRDYVPDNDDKGQLDNAAVRPRVPVSVRYDSYFAPVDEAHELAPFELSWSPFMSMPIRSWGLLSSSRKEHDRHRSKGSVQEQEQYSRTLELLNERTRLAMQLSDYRLAWARTWDTDMDMEASTRRSEQRLQSQDPTSCLQEPQPTGVIAA